MGETERQGRQTERQGRPPDNSRSWSLRKGTRDYRKSLAIDFLRGMILARCLVDGEELGLDSMAFLFDELRTSEQNFLSEPSEYDIQADLLESNPETLQQTREFLKPFALKHLKNAGLCIAVR